MPDYRIFVRSSAVPFDGATAEDATYTLLRHRYTTTDTSAVGEWSATALLRGLGVASLVQVFSDDAAAGGDTVQVVASTGTIRTTALFQPQGSGWLWMEPDDLLRVTSAAGRNLEIVVNDLSDDQLAQLAAAQLAAAAISLVTTLTSITLNAPAAVPAPAGDLVVFLANFNVAGNVVLPALAAVPEGRRITFVRVSGTAIPTIQTATPATDQVNGRVTAALTDYGLRRLGDAITYLRVPSGWALDRGSANNTPTTSSAVDPVTIAAEQDGFTYITLTGGPNQSANLPAIADVAIGFGVWVRNGSANDAEVVPAGADTINGANAAQPLVAGARVFLESTGVEWFALWSDPSPPIVTSAAGAVAIGAFEGLAIVAMTNVAGVANLPDVTTMPQGGMVVLLNDGTGTISVAAAAGQRINGLLTAWALQRTASAILVSDGATGWHAVGLVSQPANITSGVDVTLTAWVDSPQVVLTTGGAGQAITLPLASLMRQGAFILMRNTSVNNHVLAADAADTIDGAANIAVNAGLTALAYRTGANTWLAIVA